MKKKFDRTANTQAQEYTQQLDMNWFSAGFHKDQYDVFRGEPLFRGDSRGLQILKEGFEPWGTNTDLISHLGGGKDSAFIPASIYLREAIKFPFSFPDGSALSHVFEIHTYNAKINIAETLANLGLLPRESVSYRQIAKFGERAIIGNVKFSNIYCAWPVDIFDAANVTLLHPETPNSYAVLQRGTYRVLNTEPSSRILNPDYKPPTLPIHIGCHVLTAAGVVLDIGSLYGEFRESRKTGNYKNTIRKTISIASGWPGAYLTGSYFAEQTFLYTTPLSPGIQAGCTLTAGLLGSALGYYGLSHFATRLYDSGRNNENVVKSVGVVRTKGLTCSVTKFSHAQTGTCVVASNMNHTIQKQQNRPSSQIVFRSASNQSILNNPIVATPSHQDPRDFHLEMLNYQTNLLTISQSSINDPGIQHLQANLATLQQSAGIAVQPYTSTANILQTRQGVIDNSLRRAFQTVHPPTQVVPEDQGGDLISGGQNPSSFCLAIQNNQVNPLAVYQDPGMQRLENSLGKLSQSRNHFFSTVATSRPQNLDKFTLSAPRPVHISSSREEAERLSVYGRNYFNMEFSGPLPAENRNSFWSHQGSDSGGYGKWVCDNTGHCVPAGNNGTNCQESNARSCESSLFK